MKTMKRYFLLLALAFVAICCASYGKVGKGNNNTINATYLGKITGDKIIVTRKVDLKGKKVKLPQGYTLVFKKGIVKNGTLIGNKTKISCDSKAFDHVTIEGDWNVPKISTALFVDLNYDNSLRDVMALTNEGIINDVEILEGTYYIKLTKNQETGFYITSNTNVRLDGIIRLRPNGFTNYQIVKLKGQNCSFNGTGMLIGDKLNHLGSTGEWGMGVEISRAENATVSGITIKDCWGDCIYVGNESKNVTINNCALDNGRRQGISITSADGVVIRDCIISNISGTDPGYAIDVEPNANETVNTVMVNNVKVHNCTGGYEVWGNAKDAKVRNVSFTNCTVRGTTAKYPMLIMKAEDISIEGCEVDSDSDYSVLVQEITSIKLQENTFKAKGRKPLNIIQSKRTEISNNEHILK